MSQSFMPEHAPFVAVAFLGTIALVALLSAGATAEFFLGRLRLAAGLAAAVLVLCAAYVVVLFGASAASETKTLRRGDRKYFCEIDCHLAYWIESAAASPGRVSVVVRTWFDPNTIAGFRGNAPLTPNPRIVRLGDAARGRLLPSSVAGTPLSTPLRPGESYTTELVFRPPAGFRARTLFLGDPPGVECVLVGHENSPGHGRILFALD